ncbi:hypothetical protein HDV00_003505 [Rhizophlyctis rosea]|nr:hypothetical protein HDV00_003505 [Rhizophlyctis rosea]
MTTLWYSRGMVREQAPREEVVGRTLVQLSTGAERALNRIIHLNDAIKNKTYGFLHNGISTGKYNPITFVPKFLYEQFSKYANLFFLFTACIQQIGDISPTGHYATAIPLSVVIIASAVKELAEDLRRHRQDAEVNTRHVNTLKGSAFEPKRWRDVEVGDIVRIENGQFFPADLILLSSSEPDGLAYIETSNLDGETNLKIRQAQPETANMLTPESMAQLDGVIKSELPNNSLYTFEGVLTLKGKDIPLEPNQMLLRGAMLRNTRWLYGVVIFTGHETKLMRNATATPIKRTKVDAMVNQNIVWLFTILVTLAVICAFGALIRQSLRFPFESNFLMLEGGGAPWARFPLNILTYILLFNNLIPLSLIVTMEFVKYFLGTLINADLDMYHDETDTPATARTSSLVEELGQIDFIFSDKTGTLTCNVMEFKMCSIAGIGYAETVPDDRKWRVDEDGRESGYHDFRRLREHREPSPTAHVIREFLTLLATCHTVIPEVDQSNPKKIVFQASSPDEGALVKGAQTLGYTFTTRRPRSVTFVTEDTREHEFEILAICEFNSTRKRMSLVARTPDGKVVLYVKGADTVILERLAPTGNPYVDATCIHLEEYASEGLRTLCLAYREIPESEFQTWKQTFDKASTQISGRQDALDAAAELIEKDLMLLGATAIEDKLQDGVPDTIATLAQAGIKLWVLTGDRQETAINIGYSCKLINEEMTLLVCGSGSKREVEEFLGSKLLAVTQGVSSSSLNGGGEGGGGPNVPPVPAPVVGNPVMAVVEKVPGLGKVVQWVSGRFVAKVPMGKIDKDALDQFEDFALVIDGKALGYALEDDLKLTFLKLAVRCRAVVCCRVSPLQKALVVKLVKQYVHGSVTLAIGDGANDVGMIQAAHVGVGISGMEGLQAARSADFAIAQFRYLKKLVIVHGGWAYARMGKLVLYSFYKNITLYLLQLWFAFDNGFSGQTLVETWTQACYNIIFAVFQPLAIGVFDQYVSSRSLDRYPQLYKLGQTSFFFNARTFWAWILNSFLHSIVIYAGMKAVYSDGHSIIARGDADGSNWTFGEAAYTVVLITITWKAALVASYWVRFTFMAIFGSILLWGVFFPVYCSLAPLVGVSVELRGVVGSVYGAGAFWFAVLVVPVMANLRDYVWK